MKQYEVVDLTGDSYLNPKVAWGDGTGTHQRKASQITSIAIHHNAIQRAHDYDSVAQYRAEAASHYAKLGPGLQYNECIDNVGTRFIVRPETTWLYANGSAENVTAYVICLDGNFENQQPTREQLESLYQRLVELCTQRPDIPATWPNVRPHASYTATACCGANLRNRIYAIQDQASAQAQLLNQGEYDWPSLQPQAPVTPTPVPPPVPPTVEVNYRVIKAGKQLGAYKLDSNAWNKYKAENAEVIVDQTGLDVTEQLRAKFEPVTPPAPPVPQQGHDYGQENNDLLKQILDIVKSILNKIGSIFK
jgi:hypothetical protein